jgi:hypothetical protein
MIFQTKALRLLLVFVPYTEEGVAQPIRGIHPSAQFLFDFFTQRDHHNSSTEKLLAR